MTGQRRPGPVGRGYMPKGGVAAAQRHNEAWREQQATRVASIPEASPSVSESPVVAGVSTRASAAGAPAPVAPLPRVLRHRAARVGGWVDTGVVAGGAWAWLVMR